LCTRGSEEWTCRWRREQLRVIQGHTRIALFVVVGARVSSTTHRSLPAPTVEYSYRTSLVLVAYTAGLAMPDNQIFKVSSISSFYLVPTHKYTTHRQPTAGYPCTKCRLHFPPSSTPPHLFNAIRICKGVAVMRRRSDSWLNATQILKVAGFDKPQRTRVLEREVQKGEHEKVQGGYGKYQGGSALLHYLPSVVTSSSHRDMDTPRARSRPRKAIQL
jgi:hypothetical protein